MMSGYAVKSLLSIAITATLLGGCVQKDSSEAPSGASNTTADSAVNNGSAGSNTTTTAGSGTGTFFNDQAGIGYANSLGGSVSRLFSAGFGGSSSAIARDPSSESGITMRASSSENDACDSGSVDTTSVTDDGTGEITSLSMDFNNCNSGGSLTTGAISMTTSTNGDNQQIDLTFSDFATVDTSGSSSINGSISLNGSAAGDESSFTISGPALAMESDTDSVSFNNYSMTVANNSQSGASSMGLTAEIVSDFDGTVNFNVNPPLSTPDDSTEYPVSGRILMTHEDGSSLDIQADNGDNASFDYIITSAGSTTSGTELWVNSDLILPSD